MIARGYRGLAWVFIAVYVAPVLTLGVWKLRRRRWTGRGWIRNDALCLPAQAAVVGGEGTR